MRSIDVTAGAAATAREYNRLRQDAYASSMLLPHEQDTPDLTLYVEPGVFYLGGKPVVWAGGSSGSFTAPSANPRIDLLVMSAAGALSIVSGTEAASPTAPTYPAGYLVICEVYNVVSQTTVRDANAAGCGYIYRDARPSIAVVRPRAKVSLNFETSARYNQGGSTPVFNAGPGLVLSIGGTSAYTQLDAGADQNINTFNYDPSIAGMIAPSNLPVAGNTIHYSAIMGAGSPGTGLEVLRHFGFYIKIDAGAAVLYSTWANGTTWTIQSLGAITNTDRKRMYAKLYSGSRIEFYLDNELVYTATANLPSGAPNTSANTIMRFEALASAGSDSSAMYVMPWTVEWNA